MQGPRVPVAELDRGAAQAMGDAALAELYQAIRSEAAGAAAITELVKTMDDDSLSTLQERVQSEQQKRYQEKCNETLCTICYDARRDVVCLPCGHVCMCSSCVNKMPGSQKKKCPVCRATVREHEQVIMS